MKKAAFILSVIFAILAFVGIGHVLYNGGRVNAGYAIIPMVLALACIAFCRNK
jgi:hypothetical protein